jgi:hypothetical protein
MPATNIHSCLPRLLLALVLCSTGAAYGLDSANTPTSPAVQATRLAFQDFFTLPVGPSGLQLSPALLAATGRQVRLVGYMVAREESEAGRFLLTPRPVRMSEHADGEADDLPPATVTVWLPANQAALRLPHQDGLIELIGRLEVGRDEAADGRVSWFRLYLDAPSP